FPLFFSMLWRPPISPLFPYTTLFRSGVFTEEEQEPSTVRGGSHRARKEHSPNTALVDLESSPAVHGGSCDVLGRNTVVIRVKKDPGPRSGRDKLTYSRSAL